MVKKVNFNCIFLFTSNPNCIQREFISNDAHSLTHSLAHTFLFTPCLIWFINTVTWHTRDTLKNEEEKQFKYRNQVRKMVAGKPKPKRNRIKPTSHIVSPYVWSLWFTVGGQRNLFHFNLFIASSLMNRGFRQNGNN